MKRILVLLLALSLIGNGWLLVRAAQRSWTPTANDGNPTATASSHAAAQSLSNLNTRDPAALSDALRVAGVEGELQRAMLEGILRRQHREKLAAVRIDRARHEWWRAGRTVQDADAALARAMIDEPLQLLFGRSPFDARHAESRYAFLPEEKRRQLAQIDLDYADMLTGAMRSATTAQTRIEMEQQRMLVEEKKRDVMAALTPEELAEYNLRFGPEAFMVNQRAATMATTEPEYRALRAVIDEFNAKSRALTRGESFVAAYDEVQRTAAQQLVAAIGYERALDYMWSGYNTDYTPLRRAVSNGQLPPEVPAKVMELALETGRKAAAAHMDAGLTLEQKRAALVALQHTARAQIDALLPAEVQRDLPANALAWLSDLETGRYRLVQPSLLSSGGYTIGNITSPTPPARRESPALPLRATGK